MRPRVKFALMSIACLLGLSGGALMLFNASHIHDTLGNAVLFWGGLVAVILLFEVMLFLAIDAGFHAAAEKRARKERAAKQQQVAERAAESEELQEDEIEPAEEAPEAEEAPAEEEAEELFEPEALEEEQEPAEEEPAEEEPAEEEPTEEEDDEARMAAILAIAESDDDEDEDESEESDDEDKEEDAEVTDAVTGLKIVVHYRRSFMARLIQSQDKVQDYYNGLKNVLLSYEGVKSRVSWNYDSFNRGRKQLAKMNIRGKSLMLYLALDPKEFEDTKYFFTDVSDKTKFSKVPMRVKIRSGRGFKHGVELIEKLMAQMEISHRKTYHPEDFHMPYETTEQLIERGLIKVVTPEEEKTSDAAFVMENLSELIRDEVSVAEADALFSDDVARMATKHVVREHIGNKKTYINLDTICENFEDGATVNLAALKEKKLVPANVGRIKVLARGRMTKQMTIEADDFSIQAVKMIVLTGGEAVETD